MITVRFWPKGYASDDVRTVTFEDDMLTESQIQLKLNEQGFMIPKIAMVTRPAPKNDGLHVKLSDDYIRMMSRDS